MKSLNQLYKDSGAKATFKDWLKKGQELFNWKKAEGSIPNQVSFLEFANQVNLNADAKTKKKFGDTTLGQVLKAGVKVGADVISQKEAQKQAQQAQKLDTGSQSDYKLPEKKDNTILGMKPIVFYPVLGVVVLGAAFGIYKIVKKFTK
jgi:hypothetical protein